MTPGLFALVGRGGRQRDTWTNWLGEEFRTSLKARTSNANGEIIYIEKIYPGQHTATPLTNFAGYRLLTKLCLHKSKIAQDMHDEAMLLLGHVKVGDQRLHEVLDVRGRERRRIAPVHMKAMLIRELPVTPALLVRAIVKPSSCR